ncbi:MAG: NADH-quinone oxidoreductase subunit C [Caldisericaceae bacterium]
MIDEVIKSLPYEVIEKRKQRIIVKVEGESFASALNALKGLSFNRLNILTAVDFIKEKEFEIVAILHSDENKVIAIVKTRIPRDNPSIETITNIYPNAYKYEIEMSEMFGIKVLGNPDSGKEFVLEDWKDLPPLRKDFDSIKYATEHYESRNVEVKYD